MKRAVWTALVAAVGIGTGCADHEFEPPDRVERVQRATSAFSVTLFDTIAWGDEVTRLTEGNVVYSEECRRCHGPLGLGDTDYARQRNLTIPSLVAPDWRLAQIDSLRRKIFTGHEAGMPVFGDGGLTPRQIDATAAYVLGSLRPDVLGPN
jgi:mono/diheme cytochrome c family protein